MKNISNDLDVENTEETLLLTKMKSFDLSVRTHNCMKREGLVYVKDLVQLREEDLYNIPNMGKKSIQELQWFLNKHGLSLGMDMSYCDFYAPQEVEEIKVINKDEEIESYVERGLLKHVELLSLSVRSLNCLRELKVKYIGDLVIKSERELIDTPNFGRKSLIEIKDALNSMGLSLELELNFWPIENLDSIAEEYNAEISLKDTSSLKQYFFTTYRCVANEKHRYIIDARFGISQKPKTLEAIAVELGLTRERVRQIQKKVSFQILQCEFWDDILRVRLNKLRENRTVPLYLDHIGVEDNWFSGFEENQDLLKNILVTFSEDDDLSFLSFEGREILTLIGNDDFKAVKYDFLSMLEENIDSNLTIDDVEMFAETKLAELRVSELSPLFLEDIYKELNFSFIDGEMVLVSIGNTLISHLTALLNESPEPVHYEKLVELYEEKYGVEIATRYLHASLGHHKEFLIFARGTYGLEKHISLSLEQQEILLSKAEMIISGEDHRRQWHARDIIKKISKELDVADVDNYLLCIVLRNSDKLRYLGKQVWQFRSDENLSIERIQVSTAVYDTLKENGEPLHIDKLRKLISEKRGVGLNFQLQDNELYSRVTPSTYGLLERDFILSLSEQRTLKDTFEEILQERGYAYHKTELIEAIGEREFNNQLTEHMILGILRSDERFKSWSGGFVGLSCWEKSGRHTVPQAMKIIAEGMTRPLSSEEIMSRVFSMVGYQFNRNALSVCLNKYNLSFSRSTGLWSRH
jgi:RNA polymerase alpha subunit/sigma-70-like protein